MYLTWEALQISRLVSAVELRKRRSKKVLGVRPLYYLLGGHSDLILDFLKYLLLGLYRLKRPLQRRLFDLQLQRVVQAQIAERFCVCRAELAGKAYFRRYCGVAQNSALRKLRVTSDAAIGN